MTNLILFLAALVLLGYFIERNHRRQRPRPSSGSVGYEDRDERRVADDLRALPAEPVLPQAETADRPLWSVKSATVRHQ